MLYIRTEGGVTKRDKHAIVYRQRENYAMIYRQREIVDRKRVSCDRIEPVIDYKLERKEIMLRACFG